jgi:ABC-type lipoprotein release transport system permease subunit
VKEVVVGAFLAAKLGYHVDAAIEINHHTLTVTGILDAPASATLLGGVVIMALSMAQEVYEYPQLINMVVVTPNDGVTEQVLSDRIDAEVPGVGSLTGEARNDAIAPILRDLELWSLGIRGAIAGFNTILILVVSMITVFERRRELATFNALGIPLRSIIRVVVTETGLTGLFGWMLGLPLGLIAALLIVYWYTLGPLSILLANIFLLVSPMLVLETLLVTLVLSGVAGLIAALTLVRNNPAAMLRSDS